MQVKDYVQALTDDSKIKVEKIGSGNWYWVFPSDEKKEKKTVLAQLAVEREKVDGSVTEMEAKIEGMKREKADADEDDGRKALEERYHALKEEVERLRTKEATALESGEGLIERKRGMVGRWKKETEGLTDNIYILEAYLKKLVGGDREGLHAILMECYGSEYVEDEGLRDLAFD